MKPHGLKGPGGSSQSQSDVVPIAWALHHEMDRANVYKST